MRRSICYCEPAYATAGEINTWKFVYTPAAKLPKGTLLRFDLGSEGRAIDWEIPQVDPKATENAIYMLLEGGKLLTFKEVVVDWRFTPLYECSLSTDVDAGSPITIVIGAPKGKTPSENNGSKAQCTAQRRRSFLLYIDSTGKGRFQEPEVFHMDIKGGQLKNIRVWAPSYVIKNHRFDAVVRFEDEHGNLTSNAPEDTLIELSYENLRENLNWKLFVPETGFIALPNLYFNEAGIYTIQLKNTKTKEIFRASPIKCFSETHDHLFWGLLHGESERIDSAENIEGCLRHFRDEKALNFFATSHFESQEETPNEIWKIVTQNAIEFDEAERFTSFIGFQWAGEPRSEGLRQILYIKDGKQILRKKDIKGSSLKKIYKSLTPKEILSIPSFTMGKNTEFDFKEFNPDFERVVEIYNAWGSSECTKKEGNTRPIDTAGKKGIKESPEGTIMEALKNGCRFGFVAGGLDDRGVYSEFFEGDQVQYSPGLTAIIAKEQTKQALTDALFKRSCYATTGERMVLGYTIAHVPMGGEISTADKPGLIINRHISGFAAGTANLKSIEIIRNGEVIHTIKPKSAYHAEFAYDDMEDMSKVHIISQDSKLPPFIFYYIRVTQEDGHIAWGSPIWIDYVKLSATERKARRQQKVVTKPVSIKEEIENFDVDEDEDEDDLEVYDDDE
jgi:hypothetical protein